MKLRFALRNCRLCGCTIAAFSKSEKCCSRCALIYGTVMRKAKREARKQGISDITELVNRFAQEMREKEPIK